MPWRRKRKTGSRPAESEDLLGSTVLAVLRVNADREQVGASAAFIKLLSGPNRAGVASILDNLILAEDRAGFVAKVVKVIEAGERFEKAAVRLTTPDGRIIGAQASGEPWRSPEGDWGASLYFWDQPEDEYIVSWSSSEDVDGIMASTRSFLVGLPDPALLVDTQGKIVHANARFYELFGRRPEDLVGKPVAVVFEDRQRQWGRAMRNFAKLMRSGPTGSIPTHWLDQAGTKVPVTMSGSLVRSPSGELVGMAVIGRDRRDNELVRDLEAKRAELERALAELKQLDAMKDEILSLVGHELRAPLANIVGFAEFLHEWKIDDEQRQKYARIIYQESQHLKRLVNNILDLTRMESGRIAYERDLGSINPPVQAAADSLRSDAAAKSITLLLELAPDLTPVMLDPDRIQQVATNLIHNAIKFSPVQGTVRVSTDAVEEGVRVTVADQGIGIDPKDAEKVFEKFGRIRELKRHTEGAGLGMPIARHIIESGHGGKLWFESEGAGQGTVFRFVLPAGRLES